MLLQRTTSGVSGLIDITLASQFAPYDTAINMTSVTKFNLTVNDKLLLSTGEMIGISSSLCTLSSTPTTCSVLRAQATPLSVPTARGGATGSAAAAMSTSVTFVKRPASQASGPINFTLSAPLNQADAIVSLLDGPSFPLSLLTDGDTLLISGEVVKITGVCGVAAGVCPILRSQLGTSASAIAVATGARVLLHTPFSSSGFLASASTYPVDYHVGAVSGRYVGWNLTLSTSVASVSGTMVTQLTIIQALGCGCAASSGNLIFSGGGGSGASGTFNLVSDILTSVTLSSGGRGYTSAPTVTLGGVGCSSRTDLIVASIGAGGTGCLQSSGSLTFSGIDGSGAAGTYSASGGKITAVNLTAGGSFYTYVPTVTVSDTACTGYAIDAVLSDPKLAGFSRRVTRVATYSLYDGGLFVGVQVPFFTIPTHTTFYTLSSPSSCGSQQSQPSAVVNGTVLVIAPSTTTFMLDFRAGNVAGMYVNWTITVTSQAGSSDVRRITSYGSDRTVTVDSVLSSVPTVFSLYRLDPPTLIMGTVQSYNSSNSFKLDSNSLQLPHIYDGWTFVLSTQVNISLSLSVTSISLSLGGSGYQPNSNGPLNFIGGGGSGASGWFSTDANGVVTQVMLTSGGSGYTSAPLVEVNATQCSSDAIITASISSGTGCTVSAGNISFIGGGGSGASAIYSSSNGAVISVRLLSGGFGYTSIPSPVISDSSCAFVPLIVSLADPWLAGISGQVVTFTGDRTATLSITLPVLPTPTTGYTISPVSMAPRPLTPLSGFVFVPEQNSAYSLMLDANVVSGPGYSFDSWFLGTFVELSDGRVGSINIVSGGSGCVSASGSLIFSGGGGIGAAGVYTSVGGIVTSVQLTSLGSFYTSTPNVSVSDSNCFGVRISAVLTTSTSFGMSRPAVSLVSLSTGQLVSVNTPFSNIGQVVSYRLTSYQGCITSVASAGPNSNLPTPISTIDGVLNASSTPSSLILDAAAAQTQGIYNGRAITFTTSISNISISGAVTSISLNNSLLGAAGCIPGSSGEISFSGGSGSGARGTFSIDSTGTTGIVSLIAVGNGYNSPPSVSFPASGCNLSPGTVVLTISSGTGCVQSGGSLIITGSATPATGTYTTLNGAIVGVVLLNGGSGYSSEPVVTVSDSSCVGYSIRASLSDPAIAGSTRRIKSYAASRVAQLSEPLLASPTNSTRYRIKQTAYVTGWISMPLINSVGNVLVDSSALSTLPSLDPWILSSSITLTTSIASLNISSPGFGCNASTGTLAFVGGGGGGASASYNIQNGSIYQIALISQGNYYTSVPTVQLSDPSCQNVLVTATLSDSPASMAGTTRQVISYTSSLTGITANFPDSLALPPSNVASYQINPSPALIGTISLESYPTTSSMILDFVPWTTDLVAPYLGVTVGAGSAFDPYTGRNVTFTSSVANVSLALSVVGLTIGFTGSECATVYGTLNFVGGGGSGATGQYSIQNGRLLNVSLITGGTGYTSAPQVTLSTVYGCYSQPSVTAIMGLGGNANAGCVSGQLVFSGGGGVGASGNFISVNGLVVSVSLTSRGAGYMFAPSVTAPGCRVSISVLMSDAGLLGSSAVMGIYQSNSRMLNLQTQAVVTPSTWTGYTIQRSSGPVGIVLKIPQNNNFTLSVDAAAATCSACLDRRGAYSGPLLQSSRDRAGWGIT